MAAAAATTPMDQQPSPFSQVLPAELVQFTALFQKGQVELRWETATELNNAGFDIQRSYRRAQLASPYFVPDAGTTQETQLHI